jgi:hypothetical protein
MDLSPLRNEYTFGANRIYLLFDKLGFTTTYFVSINKYVIEQFGSDIGRLNCPLFLNWYSRDVAPKGDNVLFLRPGTHRQFSGNPLVKSFWDGATVTFVSMQLAYYMGFSTVVLIGVDHHFTTGGTPHRLVESAGPDPDHFDRDYFGRGVRWQLPDLEASEFAYGLAKRAFEASGRQILDATVGGKLTVFPKIEYAGLFGKT